MVEIVLVDTSAWIQFLRDGIGPAADILRELLPNGQAGLTGLVATELMRGARGDEERHVLRELFDLVPWLPTSDNTYREAGELGCALGKKGRLLKTVDLVIAQVAIEQQIPILTLDKHFTQIAANSKLSLVAV